MPVERRPLPTPFARFLALLLAALLAGCGGTEPVARLSGLIIHQDLREISGLAASHLHEGVLWVHNDGGHAPELYAISSRGRLLARLAIEGVINTDWEDLASFEQDGQRYLLIADTGDNGGLRRTLQLHAIAEPQLLEDAPVQPAWTLTFRWPDGPRDCEAVAVDVASGQILLISKKRQPPELFALPLPTGTVAPRQVLTARKLGELAGVPQPDPARAETSLQARVAGQVTSADVGPDGSMLAVLTYQDVLLYRHHPGEDWGQSVARAPAVHTLPLLPQAEALGFSSAGTGLFVTGEFSPAPLYWLRPPELADGG